MALTAAQVVANELEKVISKVPALFDRDDTFFSTIEKRPAEKVSDRDMRIPLELRPGGRFGYYDPDGGDLGRGDGPSFDKAVVSVVHMRHAIEWTKKAEWATDEGRKAVVDTFKHLLAKAMPEFRRHVDGQCVGAGDGVIGTITSASTSGGKDIFVCASPPTANADGFGIRLMRYGQFINVFNSTLTTRRTISTLGTVNGEGPIDSYDMNNKTIRINAATAGVTAGDKIVASGLTSTPPAGLLGIQYHHNDASTGTWLGFDRSTTPEIRANRVNAGGAGLALPMARLAMSKIGDRLGKSAVEESTAWMHPCQKSSYEQLGQAVSMIMKSPSDEKLNLYFGDGMRLAGAPIEDYHSWDKRRIDFVVKSAWGRSEMKSPGFYTVDGRKIFEVRGSSGGVATSQLFYICASMQIYSMNPPACSYISDLAVESGY